MTYTFGIWNPPFPPLMPMTVATYLAKYIAHREFRVARTYEGMELGEPYRTRCAAVHASNRSSRLIGIRALLRVREIRL